MYIIDKCDNKRFYLATSAVTHTDTQTHTHTHTHIHTHTHTHTDPLALEELQGGVAVAEEVRAK